MNKKVLLFLIATPLLAGCAEKGTLTLIDLKEDEVFNTADGLAFRNLTEISTTKVNIRYAKFDDYYLLKSLTPSGVDLQWESYNGYYYALRKVETESTYYVGDKTTKVVKNYSYISYGEGATTLLKEVVATEVSCSYESKTVKLPHEYTLTLYDYFPSETDFSLKLPTLYSSMDRSAEKVIRIEPENITNISSNKFTFPSGCYVEKNNGEISN